MFASTSRRAARVSSQARGPHGRRAARWQHPHQSSRSCSRRRRTPVDWRPAEMGIAGRRTLPPDAVVALSLVSLLRCWLGYCRLSLDVRLRRRVSRASTWHTPIRRHLVWRRVPKTAATSTDPRARRHGHRPYRCTSRAGTDGAPDPTRTSRWCAVPTVLKGELHISWRNGSYRVALADADGMKNQGDTGNFIRILDDRPLKWHVLRPASDRRVTRAR